MTKKKTLQENLQERLAKSVDRANERAAAPRQIPASRAAAGRKFCVKLSISLFETDLARLEGIRSFIAERGQRISTSQAVKLALRAAPLSEGLTDVLAAIRAEDGRTVMLRASRGG